jgi:hypothetical protein
MRTNIFKKHNSLPGAKKVFFVPVNTGETELYEAFIKNGFELYSLNYEGDFTYEEYNKNHKNRIEQDFLKHCQDIQPEWVSLRMHSDLLTPHVIQNAKNLLPNTIFSNWTGDVRVPPKHHFLEIGKVIDISLIVSTGHVDLYKKHGLKHVKFVQAGIDTNRFYVRSNEEREKLRAELKHDISFCANYYEGFPGFDLRNKVVVRLSELFGDRFAIYGTGWNHIKNSYRDHSEYDDQNKIYNGSKIVISVNNFNDVDMYFSRRQLNAMACGTITVSCYIPGLENYFENKKDLVWFKSVDECVNLVKYYLDHEDDARQIGLNGAEKIINCHSQYHFVRDMAKAVGML